MCFTRLHHCPPTMNASEVDEIQYRHQCYLMRITSDQVTWIYSSDTDFMLLNLHASRNYYPYHFHITHLIIYHEISPWQKMLSSPFYIFDSLQQYYDGNWYSGSNPRLFVGSYHYYSVLFNKRKLCQEKKRVFVTVRQCSFPIEKYLHSGISSTTTALQNQNGAIAVMPEKLCHLLNDNR